MWRFFVTLRKPLPLNEQGMHTMNTAVTQNRPTQQPIRTTLRRICLITDGNAHRLSTLNLPYPRHHDCISEAVLADIRTLATMIAADRRDKNAPSPIHFTDEADWFAARIIVLRVQVFYLSFSQQTMLHIANHRAEIFSFKQNIPFYPAALSPTDQHQNCLFADCRLGGHIHANLFENSQALRKIVFKLK